MAKCDYCGKEVYLPFVCKYCGGTFCEEHRLPENHNCIGLKKAKPPPEKYELKKTEIVRRSRIPRMERTILYVKDFQSLVLTLASLFFMELINLREEVISEPFFAITIPIVIVFLYALLPKYLSKGNINFRANVFGLILSIVTSFLPFKLIYFGEFLEIPMYFINTAAVFTLQIMSLEVFYLILNFIGKFSMVSSYFSYIVFYLILFSLLIPIGSTPGKRILKWSKLIFLLALITLFALYFLSLYLY